MLIKQSIFLRLGIFIVILVEIVHTYSFVCSTMISGHANQAWISNPGW